MILSQYPFGFAANIVLCEQVQAGPTAVRLFNIVTLSRLKPSFSFYALVALTSGAGDHSQHHIYTQLLRHDGYVAAFTAPISFSYGYNLDPAGPGAFYLTVTFDLDVSQYLPGTYVVAAYLDNVQVASAAFMLRFS